MVAHVLQAAFASGLIGGTEPVRRRLLAQAGGHKPAKKPRAPRRKAPAAPTAGDARPVPGATLLTCGLTIVSRLPTRMPHPWECNSRATWNSMGLGHSSEFEWDRLLTGIHVRSAA